MPKKQNQKNYRASWKTLTLGLCLILVAGAVTAQILFNRHIQSQLNQMSVFQTRTLIVDAIDRLTDLKSSPDGQHRIPEARLQLPAPTTSIGKVVYLYQKAEDESPETIHITTIGITDLATGQLNATSVDDLFARVPEVQACSRGFAIRFSADQENLPAESMKQSGTKQLADGRTMYLWREKNCGNAGQPNSAEYSRHDAMNELEQYLLAIQSY